MSEIDLVIHERAKQPLLKQVRSVDSARVDAALMTGSVQTAFSSKDELNKFLSLVKYSIGPVIQENVKHGVDSNSVIADVPNYHNLGASVSFDSGSNQYLIGVQNVVNCDYQFVDDKVKVSNFDFDSSTMVVDKLSPEKESELTSLRRVKLADKLSENAINSDQHNQDIDLGFL